MISHLVNRDQALHECIQVAVIANVANPNYPVRDIYQVFMRTYCVSLCHLLILLQPESL